MKRTKKLITFILIAAALCMVLLSGCSGKKINLDNYVTVSFNGQNGSGTASVDIDANKISEDYDGKIKFNTNDSLGVLYEEDGDSVGSVIYDFAYVTAEPSSGLSNGDTITLKWDVEKAYISSILNCSISYSDKTYTVEGLTGSTQTS